MFLRAAFCRAVEGSRQYLDNKPRAPHAALACGFLHFSSFLRSGGFTPPF